MGNLLGTKNLQLSIWRRDFTIPTCSGSDDKGENGDEGDRPHPEITEYEIKKNKIGI